MQRYALGIDGGGSKCDAAVLDEAGAVVGWGRGGPTHVYYDPPEVISASYTEAVSAALSGVQGAEVWAAGNLPEGAPREAVTAANRLAHHLPASEVDSAFASAQEGWGLIVLAGTGSFVHGRSPDGRDLHFGGLGPILDDYGSAYAIGLLGLRAAASSDWTEARRTSLAEALPRAMEREGLRGVFQRVYVEGITRREIAALSRVVDAEAERGDRVAARCLVRAADELADVALDVIAELGLGDPPLPVIAVGSVARGSRLWWERMCQRLSEAAPEMRAVLPAIRPATGAALLALRQMGVSWTPSVVARARETEGGARPD